VKHKYESLDQWQSNTQEDVEDDAKEHECHGQEGLVKTLDLVGVVVQLDETDDEAGLTVYSQQNRS